MGRFHLLLEDLIKKTVESVLMEAETADTYDISTAPVRVGKTKPTVQTNESFSFDTLNSITDPMKRYEYCKSKLQEIGIGSSRVVFKLNDQTVLKIVHPKNPQAGLAQNQGETEKCEAAGQIAATVHNHAPDYSWIVMDIGRKLDSAAFQRLTKIDWDTYVSAMKAYFRPKDASDENRRDLQVAQNLPFFKNLLAAAQQCQLVVGDLINIANWAIINGHPKLIDFGFKKHHIGKIIQGPGGEETTG
jgi:hypothetical protein